MDAMVDQRVEVVVSIDGEEVDAGRLISHRGRGTETSTFGYETSFLARADAYGVDPALPLLEGFFPAPAGYPIFRAFADSAPDSWGRHLILRRETRGAEREGRTTRTLGEIDFLLGVRDDCRQGNVRFRDPETGDFLGAAERGVPQLVDLPLLLEASRHLEEGTETYLELEQLLGAGSSLGGARPKAHVRDTAGALSIAKFPRTSHDTHNVGAWEKVALDLAERARIDVPRSELLEIQGRSVLVVRRFDRWEGNRVGYASALTMVEGTDGRPGSYVEIASRLEEVSSAAATDLQQLWRRIAFNILISNTDDHLRNHGFLHEYGSSWRLSPAFDINPDPGPGRKFLRTAIDESDTTASVALLMSVAPFFRFREADAARTLGEVVAAVSTWRDVARRNGLPQEEISEMTPAFQHEELEIARALSS